MWAKGGATFRFLMNTLSEGENPPAWEDAGHNTVKDGCRALVVFARARFFP
jgi:hypothetical protein